MPVTVEGDGAGREADVIVVVDTEAGEPSVALREPGDFTRFHVTVRGAGDRARADAIMRSNRVGSVTDDDAVVDVAAVRRMAGPQDARWEADFAAMLEFAGTKGWLTEDGRGIRAHVERE
ncbi:MAG TPA: hypothetical protein VKU86_11605 [Acidimicrobiales bacterium]|nr:hypothetical protein [Acidimicrobiales bacterium]